MADEARNLKQYKELPENSKCWQPAKPVHKPHAYSRCCPLLSDCLYCATVRVNETDTFADEDGLNDEYIDFGDISGTVAQLHATC